MLMRKDSLPSRDDFFYPFEQHFNKIFDEFFNDFGILRSKTGFPKLDVIQKADEWIVEVAVPGLSSDDVKVDIIPEKNKHILKISGKMEKHEEDAEFHVKELRRSAFERSICLPEYVEGDPKATLKNGLLRLVWKVNSPVKEMKIKSIPIG